MVHDDLIFDVGMHKGEDTAFYLAKGYRVVGFEADPDLASQCRTRFAEAIRTGWLQIVEGAIAPSSESGTITFYRNTEKTVWGTIDEAWAARNASLRRSSEPVSVRRVSIEDAFRAHGAPHYLKIDIEGADHLVLDALHALPQRPHYISIESEKRDFARLEEELHELQRLGYTRFAAVQQATVGDSAIVTRTRGGEPLELRFEDGASGPFGEDISNWMNLEQCLRRYRTIFRLYRWFGDQPLIRKIPGGRLIRSIVRRWIVRGPLPGWYDTHAALK